MSLAAGAGLPGPLLPEADASRRLARAERALLMGNFSIGCGVMVVIGTLNDLARSLQVSAPAAGQLITAAGLALALSAPLLAAWVAGYDRRRLLVASLLWFAAGHALAAQMPSLDLLLPVRLLSVLGAAVFTPQAAAAISLLAPPAQRGRAITHIFLGWSFASVVGMPLGAWVAETLGWRWAFNAVALLSLAAALGVWRALPDGIRPAALSRADWRQVATRPVLLAIIGVTALSAAGQFTLSTYLAPYYRQVLGAGPAEISGLFLWFGGVGVLGNLWVSRHIDRLGAARAVTCLQAAMALSLLAWPLGRNLPLMLLVLAPWALGCFAANSAQQARLGMAAPALAPALIALNSSALYAGQALGASSGGLMVAGSGYGHLHWVGLGWMLAAIALSLWAGRAMQREQAHG